MSIISEFKTFIMRGNVVDLAVGVVIGAAFGKIVTSFVNDLIMPPIGMLTGGIDFSDLRLVLKSHTDTATGKIVEDAAIKYGMFINNVIIFVIQAAAIFVLIKIINLVHKKQAAAPAPPPKQEVLLTEIRDILAKK